MHVDIKTLPNGAIERSISGHITYIKYNTGDEVWFYLNSKNLKVSAIKTHDGLKFSYE
jgi:hypothetical protein